MTPLDKPLKRSLAIDGADYVITLSPGSLRITLKGRRLGVELPWKQLVSGESALAVALHASIGKFQVEASRPGGLRAGAPQPGARSAGAAPESRRRPGRAKKSNAKTNKGR